jgi:hypothetical protein
MLGSQKHRTLSLKGLLADQSIHKISASQRPCGRKSAGAISGHKKAPEFPPGLSLSVNQKGF